LPPKIARTVRHCILLRPWIMWNALRFVSRVRQSSIKCSVTQLILTIFW
jgi:hypothetical protein